MSKRMGAAFWAQHVEAASQAGISSVAYAERHGLHVKRLYFWQRRLRADAAHVKPARRQNSFVALQVAVAAPANCILTLTSGLRLELSELPAPQWLAALAREIR